MNPWEDRHVQELVDELERFDRIPSDAADTARSALEKGEYRTALEVVLSASRSDRRSGDARREEKRRTATRRLEEIPNPAKDGSSDTGNDSSLTAEEMGSDGPIGDGEDALPRISDGN